MSAAARLAAAAVAALVLSTPEGRAGAVEVGRSVLGQDGADAAPAGKPGQVVNPVPGACVSSGYGRRWGTFHYGLDLAAPLGTPIRAVAAGVVTYSGPARGYGQMIRVRHAGGAVTEYGHERVRLVDAGQRVAAGQVIAKVGQEGQSTGPHLHLRVFPAGVVDGKGTDPRPWLRSRGVRVADCG